MSETKKTIPLEEVSVLASNIKEHVQHVKTISISLDEFEGMELRAAKGFSLEIELHSKEKDK